VIGPSFAQDEMADVIENIIATYVRARDDGERFIDTVARIGISPFKTNVYVNRAASKSSKASETESATS
jgi:sulfite reductase (NADPH) hemoprotein beta-component